MDFKKKFDFMLVKKERSGNFMEVHKKKALKS